MQLARARSFDSKIIFLTALALHLLVQPASQQIFSDDEDDADVAKLRSSTTPPPPLTNLITLDKSRLDWACNDDKNRALIRFNFFNLTDALDRRDLDESFKIYYKYLSCHPATCRFIHLATLNSTRENTTLRILLDNYYKYEFRFTYQQQKPRSPGHQVRKRGALSSTPSNDSSEEVESPGARPVETEEEVILCPFSTISTPIKFGVCDQYEFNIHQMDECSLILSKPTPSGFVKYIYLLIVVVVALVIAINLIKKIKFKYQIIKS